MRIGGIKLPKNQSDVEIKKKGNSVEVIVSDGANFNNGNITQEILRFTFDNLSYYDLKRSDKYYQKKGEELMAMHQAFYKQIDPIQIVLRGAILKCTHSSDNAYIKLDTLEDFGVYSHKHSVMTCTDCKASENIFNFGLCGNSVYNPVYGKDLPSPTETGEDKKGNCRHVCFPILADEWVIGARDGSSSIYIDKETCEIEQFQEALLTNASLLCYYGGIITIEQNPEEEIEEEIKEEIKIEEEKEEELKKEIEAADVQLAPWLFAYRGEPDISEKNVENNFDNDEELLTEQRKAYDDVDWYAFETIRLENEKRQYVLDKKGQEVTLNKYAIKQYKDKKLEEPELALQFTEEGGFVNEDGRYWIAVGPGILWDGYADLPPEEQTVSENQMDFGTEIDVVLEKKSLKNTNKKKINDGIKIGERVYIKCVVGDVKNHTYSKEGNSKFQTGEPHPGTSDTKELNTQFGVYIEFMYKPEKIEGDEEVGTMSDYNVVAIIVYEREWGNNNDIQQ